MISQEDKFQIFEIEEINPQQDKSHEEIKQQQHFGNNCVFCMRKGIPLITIGPHWPLALCLLFFILFGTYFMIGILSKKSPFIQILVALSGMNLAIQFAFTALKNPGINLNRKANNNDMQDNYCKPCGIYKDIQTVHCIDCDICIKGYDHHCPWTGKCIGEGNLNNFRCFILSFIFFFIINLIIIL